MTTLPSPSLRDILSPSPAVSAAAGAATAGPSNSAYLSPLQHSLVYELTTRRAHIHAQRLRARFWREREQRLSTGSLDEGAEHEEEEELDRLIEERKARLELLRLRRALRDTIVENADAAFVINRSLSTTQPPPFLAHGEPALHVDGPLSAQPARILVHRRDQLALKCLEADQEVKSIRADRAGIAMDIEETRTLTSSLLEEIQKRKSEVAAQRDNLFADATAREIPEKRPGPRKGGPKAVERVHALEKELATVLGQKEMAKGTLRGIILESGVDWYASRELRELMLSLTDDDGLDSEEEEVDKGTDEGLNEDQDEDEM